MPSLPIAPDGLYQLILTGGFSSPGDLRLRYCPSGFDLSASPPGCNETPSVQWRSNTGTQDTGASGGTSARFQGDGNLVVYDGNVPPDGSSTALWNAGTCATCGIGGKGVRFYLPGPDSVCPCQTLMCIVVDLTSPPGGVDYYYAVTVGAAFTKNLTSCPAPP
jgi:hypothetical protein